MKTFLILTIAALSQARPEAGYTYNAPQGGGNFLSAGSSGFTSGGSSGGYSQGGPSGGYSQSSSSGAYSQSGSSGVYSQGTSSGGYSQGGSSGGYSQGGSSSFGGGNSLSSTGFGGNTGGFSGTSAGFGDSSSSSFSSGGFQQQAPLIQKHIYVHVAPEEPEQQNPRQQLALSAPRKHYKIVFIKAPSSPSYTGAQLQLPQQDQEKTLIYVLVKRPEDQPSLTVNAARPTTPSKPEVYFIRYKTQSGGGADIASAGGLSSGGISGASGPALGSTGSGQSNIFSSGSGSTSGYTTGSGAALSSGGGSSSSSLSGGSGPSTGYGVPAAGGSGPY